MLDDVAPVNDPGGPLLHESLGPFQNFAIGGLAPAAHQHRSTRNLDDPVVFADVVSWIGLDHVGAQLRCLPDQR